MVIASIYLSGRRRGTYVDPGEFTPSRFVDRRHALYEWFPFGGGMRKCIGMAFALYEQKMVLAAVLSRAELFPTEPPATAVRRSVTLSPGLGRSRGAAPSRATRGVALVKRALSGLLLASLVACGGPMGAAADDDHEEEARVTRPRAGRRGGRSRAERSAGERAEGEGEGEGAGEAAEGRNAESARPRPREEQFVLVPDDALDPFNAPDEREQTKAGRVATRTRSGVERVRHARGGLAPRAWRVAVEPLDAREENLALRAGDPGAAARAAGAGVGARGVARRAWSRRSGCRCSTKNGTAVTLRLRARGSSRSTRSRTTSGRSSRRTRAGR